MRHHAVSAEARRDGQLSASSDGGGVDAAVAAARRVVGALLRNGSGSTVEMGQIAERLNVVADELDEHAPDPEARMREMWASAGANRHDPVTGPENAVAPPLSLHGGADGSVEGATTLGIQYQGPPGCVHGGISALLLDHALGVANHWGGTSGMTAKLTLRYHRTTPLSEPLTVTARQVGVDGRRIRATGELGTADGPRVSAEGLFIDKQPPRPR